MRFACRIPTPSCRHHHNRSLSFYHSYTHTHTHCREELDLATDTDDMDQRLKYAGIFHRRKRTPGRFMMRYVIEGGRERGREGGGVILLSDRPLAHQSHFQHTHTPSTTTRMRIPNGILTSKQLFFISEAMAKYGDDYEAVVDITVRQNLQLRGLKVRGGGGGRKGGREGGREGKFSCR